MQISRFYPALPASASNVHKAVRFGERYEIYGSPGSLEAIIPLLKEQAARDEVPIALDDYYLDRNSLNVLTGKDAQAAQPFENLRNKRKQLEVEVAAYREKQESWESRLQEGVRRYIMTACISPHLKPGTGKEVHDGVFKRLFEDYAQEKLPIQEIITRVQNELLPHKRQETNDLPFLSVVLDALEAFRRRREESKQRIEDETKRFREIHPAAVKSTRYREAAKTFPPFDQLSVVTVREWLQEGTFDIRRGDRKSWFKRLFRGIGEHLSTDAW